LLYSELVLIEEGEVVEERGVKVVAMISPNKIINLKIVPTIFYL
jgi:hypothetical protein